ncbi:hypothetical protein [Nonomuraea sp. B19D2]|uniref:hypothetical protein n=1 Tax=Nonomuraea sp. B19D2 TaxID=3159561 RepID=UPI0032DBF25E
MRALRGRRTLSLITVTSLALGGNAAAAGADTNPFAQPRKVTVLGFGAVPNDRRDDTAAMQKAADYLCTHPGTTLVYPPGVYHVDRVVNTADLTADPRTWTILYDKCENVKIAGIHAKIEVKGDFTKTAAGSYGDNLFAPDKMATTPFYFQDARGLKLSGFEIDGNVEKMTQSVPQGGRLAEASEHAVHIGGSVNHASQNITLTGLHLHHMAADGILLGSGRDITIRHVQSANNIRQGLTIGQGRNVLVTQSTFRDTGVVGTSPDSYPLHSPGRGVDIEPECTPKDAEWGQYESGRQVDACNDAVGMTGNILFDHVRVTGNLGGGIAMPHGESSANVTVRHSFLRNPLGKSGDVVDMGIVGGVVEDSVLDGQNGFAVACATRGSAVQLTSPIWERYLRDLANDPSPVARGVHRQTDPTFSSTVRRNTIKGQGPKFLCQDATPVMRITDNKIKGTLLPAPPETTYYPTFGHLIVFSGTPDALCSTTNAWGKEITIERNDIFIPRAAPTGQPYGQINYCGKSIKLADNVYRTDTEDPARPLWVYYNRAQGVGSVTQDCFPAGGAIVAVDENHVPYPLTDRGTQKCLTLPQP